MQPKTQQSVSEIEARANIVKKRTRKLLREFCETKSEIKVSRLERLIKRLDKEFAQLETSYRIAKKREFNEAKITRQHIRNLCIIERYRLN